MPLRESDPVSPGVAPSPSPPQTDRKDTAPLIAISATFTAEALEPTLAFWVRELQLHHQIRFAQYNQVFQQLLDPASLIGGNKGGLNVVLVRFEDWARFRDGVNLAELEQNVRNLESAVTAAAHDAGSPLLLCICPASPDFLSDAARAGFALASEESLRAALRHLTAVRVVTSRELSRFYPVPDSYDPHADELGHVPYTPEFFAALGTMIARQLDASRSRGYKVVALDCDDTLWQGVCGEDGPEGVRLDAGSIALQRFMLAQRDAGMLLCLCSKNNPEDVLETFRAHPEMPLRLEHFAALRLNWEAKSANLRSLANELNLGLDSFILLDNSAAECAEVEAGCPEVLTLALAADSSEFAAFLDHVWVFDHWSTTEEDRKRAARYAQQAERAQAERQSASLDGFLASLKLEVKIEHMREEQLPRVAQLTERTNQMNFTTVRRSEAEIRSIINSGGMECLTVDVSDRFGSYGLVGAILFRADAKAITVDTFLLSCRALGRGVEHRMLAHLGEIAKERGLEEVRIPFAATARNRPAEALLAGAGAQFERRGDSGLIFEFPAGYLAAVRYRPSDLLSGARESQASRTAVPHAIRGPADYSRMARELREPQRILETVQSSRRLRPAPLSRDAPRTPLEEQLAQIWANLLGVPAVGIHDNFFDLGGHSLLAVQLLSVVRQTFDVDISLKVVYGSEFTVAELAKAIELREIENAGEGRYAAILKEIESLSDEEVRALLAEAEDGTANRNP